MERKVKLTLKDRLIGSFFLGGSKTKNLGKSNDELLQDDVQASPPISPKGGDTNGTNGEEATNGHNNGHVGNAIPAEEENLLVEVPTSGEEGLAVAPSSSSQVDVGVEATKSNYERDVSESKVQNANWHYLPQEMKSWAVKTSQDVYGLIEEWKLARSEAEKTPDRADLDTCLEQIETEIKQLGKKKREDAQGQRTELNKQELLRLQEVHKDQESLAWYIMKREAELKRLEKTRAEKQKRIDEMRSAANSLINNEVAED